MRLIASARPTEPRGSSAADVDFDDMLPAWARKASQVHWTPVAVASRAAELLVRTDRSRILDIGSGVGKFCHVAAARAGGSYLGVEQREELVAVARSMSERLHLTRTAFVQGDAFDIDWNVFDGIYLFNPFLENIADFTDKLPGPHRSADRYVAEVEACCIKLHGLARGVRVATYHGYGAPMPRGFEAIHVEEIGTDMLEVWQKR